MVLENGVKVVPAFVAPEDKAAAEEEFAAMKSEIDTLKGELEALKKQPAAKPAHETFQASAEAPKTGNKGLDRLTRIARA